MRAFVRVHESARDTRKETYGNNNINNVCESVKERAGAGRLLRIHARMYAGMQSGCDAAADSMLGDYSSRQ